jgi:hypothetical protein
MDRRRRMGCLFANLAEHGIGDDQRHGWASGVLDRTVDSFSTLTITEIDELISSLNELSDDYVLCGAPCPDGWPCVVDVGHIDRGEDHAREDGVVWAVR